MSKTFLHIPSAPQQVGTAQIIKVFKKAIWRENHENMLLLMSPVTLAVYYFVIVLSLVV